MEVLESWYGLYRKSVDGCGTELSCMKWGYLVVGMVNVGIQ